VAHHLASQVEAFLAAWPSGPMAVHSVHEPQLLSNQGFFAGATGLMIQSDNAMDDGLSGLLAAHRQRPPECLLTMLTFRTTQPCSCGIVATDCLGVVTAFQEKVPKPPWALG
jgi:mannose-1-phosphate guanylyltransferase